MPFTWEKRGADKSWTDADVETLLKSHEKFLVGQEIGPLKDKLREAEATHAEAVAELQKQLVIEKLAKDEEVKKYATLEKEILPIRREKRVATLTDLLVTKKQLVKKEKLSHVLKLADVADSDDEFAVLKKVEEFLTDAVNADYKYQEEISKEEAAKLAAEKAQADALLAAKRAVEANAAAGVTVAKTGTAGDGGEVKFDINKPLTKLGIVG